MVWGQTCFSVWGEVLLSHPRRLVLSRGICWRTTRLHRYPLLWASPQPCHSVFFYPCWSHVWESNPGLGCPVLSTLPIWFWELWSRYLVLWLSPVQGSSPFFWRFIYFHVAVLGLHCCTQTFSSCCGGFSCCRAQAVGHVGFSSCSSWA